MTRVLVRDGALADGRSPEPRLGVSVLVEDGVIRWIRPTDAEEDPGPADGLQVIDASGSAIVPGMVDSHSHLTMPGGAHWIDRGLDPAGTLLAVAEQNARLLTQAGVRWARDVGAPVAVDPVDGRRRAASLGVRDRWRGRRGYPEIRAAGSWVARAGTLPAGLAVGAHDGDELLALALGQLDDGADLVKLYMDGPDPATPPWSAGEVRRVVQAVRARGARRSSTGWRSAASRSAWRTGPACPSPPAPTSAAARAGRTTWRGKSSRWSRRGWSPGRRSGRQRGAAASSWACPMPA